NSGYQAASGTVDVVDSDVTVEVMLNITGAPVNLSDGVRVYPNPFGPQLTLEGVAHVRRVEVISLIGQRVLLMESNGGETLTLPTDHLQPGVYMIRLTGEHGMQSLIKVVKQ
ncbi:MAG: T9SS type A sorting domain-containing protein, partial [Bacteroidales bacterium]|nr:T9SS type A sorting domain-containing protein [Bacteroidales bacterium]